MWIVAHRGFWRSQSEQNTPSALRGAIVRGWGAELDVRDLSGRLVISHDPPLDGQCPVLDGAKDVFASGLPLFVNVKADGLAHQLKPYLDGPETFVFDTSVPDMAVYVREKIKVFTRHSDVEPTPAFYEEATGVWMDQLREVWIESADVLAHLRAGKKVALVSDELHGREHRPLWTMLEDVLAQYEGDRHGIYLCTDRAGEAERFFESRHQGGAF